MAGPWPLPGPRRSAARGGEGARVRRLGARGRDRPTPRWLAAGRGSAALEGDPLARAWGRARPRGAHPPRSRRDGARSRNAARVGGDRSSQHGPPPRARGHPRAGRCGPVPAPRSRVREARGPGTEPRAGHPDARLPHGGRPRAGSGAGARGAALRRARRDSRAAHGARAAGLVRGSGPGFESGGAAPAAADRSPPVPGAARAGDSGGSQDLATVARPSPRAARDAAPGRRSEEPGAGRPRDHRPRSAARVRAARAGDDGPRAGGGHDAQ